MVGLGVEVGLARTRDRDMIARTSGRSRGRGVATITIELCTMSVYMHYVIIMCCSQDSLFPNKDQVCFPLFLKL